MPTIFLRLLHHDDKEAALRAAVEANNTGESAADVFHVDPLSFEQVPGSPFAYWVSERVRRLFRELPPFESEGRTVKQGLATADDFRFVRCWWEVAPGTILDGANGPDWRDDLPKTQAWCRRRTFEGRRWVAFAKGGDYSPFYADLHLVVNWERDGEEMKAWAVTLPGTSHWSRRLASNDFYFRPGLTWSRRSQLGFSLRCVPACGIFSDKGPVAFLRTVELYLLLGLMSTTAFRGLLSLQMAFGSYEVGVIQRTPVPALDGPEGDQLGTLGLACVNLNRDLDRANETSHVFYSPALLQVPGATLAERLAAWQARVADAERRLAEHQREIDDLAFRLYGIDGEDRRMIEAGVSEPVRGTEAAGEMEEDES